MLREVHHFDLELSSDIARLNDPELALGSLEGLMVLDEVQRRPEISPVLRSLIDGILTGGSWCSAAPLRTCSVNPRRHSPVGSLTCREARTVVAPRRLPAVGSNDLTQLMLGVDRDSERCAELFDEEDGAVESPRLRRASRTSWDHLGVRQPRRRRKPRRVVAAAEQRLALAALRTR
jgi:hypothetical protein